MPRLRFPGNRSCGNCLYYLPLGAAGECRYNPPVIAYVGEAGAQTAFPVLAPDLWCGRHRFGPLFPARQNSGAAAPVEVKP